MKLFVHLLLSGFLLAASVTDALAQAANISLGTSAFDSDQPVEVTADSLSVDQGTGQAIFEGNVLVVQGEVRISAGRIAVIYSQDTDGNATGIERLEADGGVTFVTPTDAAESQKAVYSVGDGKVNLSGEVLLTQGQNALAGDVLVMDLSSGTGRMEGRVRTILNTGDGN